MEDTKYKALEIQPAMPSAPPAPTQDYVKPIGICDCFMFLCYTGFIVFRAMFPIWGQARAIYICRNWDSYIAEEDEETAYLELICATYGVYGLWLLTKCVRKQYWKAWNGSLNMIYQMTDEEKQKYGKITLLRYLRYYGNTQISSVNNCCCCCNLCYQNEPQNLLIQKKFSLCEKFCGIIGITFLSLGICTVPVLWCELRCFGNKFISQHDSYFKYTLGHIYKLLTCNVIHVIWFVFTRWNSEYVVDRIIANSGYFVWFPLYLIYCYFSYAYDWRYGYEKRMAVLNPVAQQPIQANAVLSYQGNSYSEVEHKSNDPPIVQAVVVSENNVQSESEHKQPDQQNETNNQIDNSSCSPYSLWLIGTLMYIVGTFGLACIWFGFETIELSDREWQLMRDTCGLYIIYKIWKTPYDWLRKNRYICSNFVSRIFVEICLFIITIGVSYVDDIIRNLQCVPFGKRYNVGALQTLVFAPLFFKNHSNLLIRWTSKLILMGYNFVVYYFVTLAINKPQITTPIFIIINYATYCFYKFMTTNKTILKTFTNIKHMFRDSWLTIKWNFYRIKFNTINSYRSSRNRMKISWCGMKTRYRQWKANSYNSRHRLTEGDPRFKVAKVSQPRLLELKKFKDYNTYHQLYLEKKQNRLPIKNTILLLKSAVNKIVATHYTKINHAVIHDVSLWDNRYDELMSQAPSQLISNLDRNSVETITNTICNQLAHYYFDDTKSRSGETRSYNTYNEKVKHNCEYINSIIYRISGLNKNIDNTHELESIAKTINDRVTYLTGVSNQI